MSEDPKAPQKNEDPQSTFEKAVGWSVPVNVSVIPLLIPQGVDKPLNYGVRLRIEDFDSAKSDTTMSFDVMLFVYGAFIKFLHDHIEQLVAMEIQVETQHIYKSDVLEALDETIERLARIKNFLTTVITDDKDSAPNENQENDRPG